MNVLNNWWKIIDSLKKHYNIDDVAVEEDQVIQVAAITINEGVVSAELLSILTSRLEEIQLCISNGICLGGVILIGSTLEGLLLGVAKKSSEKFKSSVKAPQKTDIDKWTLSELIDVATDLVILKKDRKDLSHSLRQYRNYVHPDREMKEDHHLDKHTLSTSYEVLKGVVHDLNVHAESVQPILEDQ